MPANPQVFLISERVVRSTRFGRAFGKNVIIFGRGGLSEPAFRANHPRPERWHGEFAREMVDIHDNLVPALVTLDRKQPHAILTHLGKRHRLNRVVEASACHRQYRLPCASPYVASRPMFGGMFRSRDVQKIYPRTNPAPLEASENANVKPLDGEGLREFLRQDAAMRRAPESATQGALRREPETATQVVTDVNSLVQRVRFEAK